MKVQSQTLKGIHMLDTRGERVILEHHDFPSYNLDPEMKIPKQLSFCMRYFWEFGTFKQTGVALGSFLQVWTHNIQDYQQGMASIEFR